MRRWTFVICLLGVNSHVSSQPITKEDGNQRVPRQLDFGKCCPCPSQAEARSRDGDDCPCRLRSADLDGASSIVLPTAVRTDGLFLKLAELEDDVKPFLSPEVDLASSVLQTLREATDEEYQEALERDAKRNAMKEAELTESSLKDSGSEETAEEIITIIVHPKIEDMEDDSEPQASHVQESRCIRPPLASTNTDLSSLRSVPRSQKEIVRLPKIKTSSLLHRKTADTDNSASTSNVQEHISKVEDTPTSDFDIKKLSRLPILKLLPSLKKTSLKSSNDNKENEKFDILSPSTGLTSPLLQKILGGTLENRTQIFQKKKINLPFVPKLQLDSFVLQDKNKKDQDGKKSSTWLKERPNLNIKSNLDNLLENTKSAAFNKIWKLKDVELIPSKLFKNTDRNVSGHTLTSLPILIPSHGEILSEQPTNQKETVKINKDTLIDSNIRNNDCYGIIEENNESTSNQNSQLETETPDAIPSASNKFENIENLVEPITKYNPVNVERDLPNSKQNQNNNYNDIDETNQNCYVSTSKEKSSQSNDDTLKSIEENTIKNESEENNDASAECSESIKNNNVPDFFTNDTEDGSYSENTVQQTVEQISETPLSQKSTVTISMIRDAIENQVQKIENENLKRNPDKKSDFEVEKSDLDYLKMEANILTTTFSPIQSDSQPSVLSNCSNTVSMHELQKPLDLIMQKEDRKKRYRTNEYCNEFDVNTNNNFETISDLKYLTTTQSTLKNTEIPFREDGDVLVSCLSSLSSSKISSSEVEQTEDTFINKKPLLEIDSEASNLVSQRILPLFQQRTSILETPLSLDNIGDLIPRDPLNIFDNPLPNLDPSPTFKGFNLKLSDIFKSNYDSSKDVTESQEVDPKSTMATDSSIPSFQFRLPSLTTSQKPFANLYFHHLQPPAPLLGVTSKLTSDEFSQRVADAFENVVDNLKDHMKQAHESLKLPNPVNHNIRPSLLSTDLSDGLGFNTKNTLKIIEQKIKQTSNNLGFEEPFTKNNIHSSIPHVNSDDLYEKLRTIHNNLKSKLDLIHNPSNRLNTYSKWDTKKSNTNILGNPSSMTRDKFFKQFNAKEFSKTPDLERKPKQDSILSEKSRSRTIQKPATKIPKTVQVPPLKLVTDNPNLKLMPNAVKSSLPSSSKTLQNINKHIGESQINPFKNSKIKITFSTTPRPKQAFKNHLFLTTPKSVILKNRSKGKLIKMEDSNGALSEIEPIIQSQTSWTYPQESNENLENERLSNKPWPSVTESSSSFLSKVKEAVQARLPKVMTKTLSPINPSMANAKTLQEENKEGNSRSTSDTEMFKSASENVQTVDLEPLKENVSYRCRMVCTRE